MSVARAEAALAATLLVELLVAVAAEDDQEEAEPVTPTTLVRVTEPVAAAA
jgi:hypothetical protein